MKYLLFLSLSLFSGRLLAWGDLGHGTIGFIAQEHLTPEGKGFVYSVLGAEPLATAAIFPDHVRDDQRFENFNPYHFVELPPTDGKVAPRSADTIMEEVPRLLSEAKKSLSLLQKQILFRYLTHVVGDLHQPLHVGNGWDHGGNSCKVMFPSASGKSQRKNLHKVWDSGILTHLQKRIMVEAKKNHQPIKYFSYLPLGRWLLESARADGSYAKLIKLAENTTKADWYAEAQALHTQVYPEETPLSPKERKFCFGSKKLPSLSSTYIERAIQITRERLLLGGLRLANLINKLAKQTGAKPWTQKNEEEFFAPILPVTKPTK